MKNFFVLVPLLYPFSSIVYYGPQDGMRLFLTQHNHSFPWQILFPSSNQFERIPELGSHLAYLI